MHTTHRKILAVLRTIWKGGTVYQDNKGEERQQTEDRREERSSLACVPLRVP